MRPRIISAAAIVLLILICDQVLKIWVKTHLPLGGHFNLLGAWNQIWFVENEGMAYGLKLGGANGKILLSLFRIILVVGIIWYLFRITKQKASYFLVTCISLILAGALGNIIDSVFYGLWFTDSANGDVAHWARHGAEHYATWLHGRVVDMLYFPIINGTFPKWVPFWGGEPFTFFDPVFNIADASISVGIFLLLVHQNFPIKRKSVPGMPDSPVSTEHLELPGTSTEATSDTPVVSE